jgi:predicted DNA-binding transcriptional regulator AlpA
MDTAVLTIPLEFRSRLTVSIPETAALLGVAPKTLYNQISAGCCPIPTMKFGGRRLVRVSDLERLTKPESPLTDPKPTRR